LRPPPTFKKQSQPANSDSPVENIFPVQKIDFPIAKTFLHWQDELWIRKMNLPLAK
jgi:hypothetical protein